MATSLPSLVSVARYTSPIPPAPRAALIPYGPSLIMNKGWKAISHPFGFLPALSTIDLSRSESRTWSASIHFRRFQ